LSNKNVGRGVVGDLVGTSLVYGSTISANINAIKRLISPVVNGYTSTNLSDLIAKESVTGGVIGDLGVPTNDAQNVKDAIKFLRNQLDQESPAGVSSIIENIQGLLIDRNFLIQGRNGHGGTMRKAMDSDLKQVAIEISNYLSSNPTQTVMDRIVNIQGMLSTSTNDNVEERIRNILVTLNASQTGVVADILNDIYNRVGDFPDSGRQSILDNVKGVQDKIGVGDSSVDPQSVYSGLNNVGELIRSGFTNSNETLVQSLTEFNQYMGTQNIYGVLDFGKIFYSNGFSSTSETLSRAIGKNTDNVFNDTVFGYINGINAQVQTLKGSSGSASYTKVTIDLPTNGFNSFTILDFLADIYNQLSNGVAS